MSDTRRWYTEPESFVALAALIVSVSALGLGLYEASLQRQHDRAEVWPHLEIEAFTTQDGANVLVENTGLGPAVVKSITVTLDDKPEQTWKGVLYALLGDSTRAHSNNSVFEHGVRPGDRVTLLGLSAASVPMPFWEQVGRVRIRICYASVFGEAWMVEDRLGTANHWQPVDSCPAQRAGDDF